MIEKIGELAKIMAFLLTQSSFAEPKPLDRQRRIRFTTVLENADLDSPLS